MADNCNLGQTNYGENLSWSLTKEKNVIFMEKGRKLGGVLTESPVGEKQELRALAVSHRLSCWGSQSLAGDAVCLFSYWEL